MKKAFLFTLFASQLFALAQENWGKIDFRTVGIPKINGDGTYDVRIRDYSGAGMPGATVSLYLPEPPSSGGSGLVFANGVTGTAAQAGYVVNPAISQVVTVPGYPPGSRVVIGVRVGSSLSLPTYEWIFTTLPLGGIPPGGGDEIPTPSLTGWGPEDGSGLNIAGMHPTTTLFIGPAGPILAAPAFISINVGIGRDPGYTATNLSVYAGSILVASVVPAAVGPRGFTTPPLGPGTYSIYSVITGVWDPDRFAGSTQSIPIDITVVDPVDVTLTLPAIANGQLKFQYTVNPGLGYEIQSSTNLQTWKTIETAKPTSSPALFTQPVTEAPSTYYRVQRLPNS